MWPTKSRSFELVSCYSIPQSSAFQQAASKDCDGTTAVVSMLFFSSRQASIEGCGTVTRDMSPSAGPATKIITRMYFIGVHFHQKRATLRSPPEEALCPRISAGDHQNYGRCRLTWRQDQPLSTEGQRCYDLSFRLAQHISQAKTVRPERKAQPVGTVVATEVHCPHFAKRLLTGRATLPVKTNAPWPLGQ